MSCVFDGLSKVRLRAKDRLTDDTLPPSGALNWGIIASESALSSTTGVDCKKVNGNRWQQIDGHLTENYAGNKKIDVRGKHTETVLGDHSLTVSTGNLSRNVAAGRVTDHIGTSHEESVGLSYKLQAPKQEFEAKGIISINGNLVKINT